MNDSCDQQVKHTTLLKVKVKEKTFVQVLETDQSQTKDHWPLMKKEKRNVFTAFLTSS